MNDDESSNNFNGHLAVSIEPDIHLSRVQQAHLNACLTHLKDVCHIPLVLTCTLSSTTVDGGSTRINHYIRVRQPRKVYWIRNIKEMRLSLRLPTDPTKHLSGNLVELHSCKRLPHSSRTIIHQIKPITLVYKVYEHHLKVNIR